MTIAELIDYLHAFPANARVVLPHFNSGFDDIVTVYALPIRLGTIQFGSGAHTGPDMFSDIPFEPDETAIVIDFEAATRLAEPVASQPGSAGAPRRRLGTLAGQISMSADFDTPLRIDEAVTVHLHLDKHRRSLALHRLIAGKIRRDPALLDQVRDTVDRRMAIQPHNHADPYLIEWRVTINQGIDTTIALMTDPGEHATDLRQSAPFTGILTDDERRAFLAGWRARNPRP